MEAYPDTATYTAYSQHPDSQFFIEGLDQRLDEISRQPAGYSQQSWYPSTYLLQPPHPAYQSTSRNADPTVMPYDLENFATDLQNHFAGFQINHPAHDFASQAAQLPQPPQHLQHPAPINPTSEITDLQETLQKAINRIPVTASNAPPQIGGS
ncbi:hypothetical protein BS17DRAFT_135530 [Gyrodon lividus]|nr:hypothetical protein BS17DRAFT_135530 [Gyrodon lividus]